MAWFEGELVFHLVYCIVLLLFHFLHTHISYLASLVILACIFLTMLITMLG
jgi:hypothetical protein